jgi:hypothetical protein
MKILEYYQYNNYLNNGKFMNFFNDLKRQLSILYPNIDFKLALFMDYIYCLYYEKLSIDDTINNLYVNGKLFQFNISNSDN